MTSIRRMVKLFAANYALFGGRNCRTLLLATDWVWSARHRGRKFDAQGLADALNGIQPWLRI